MNTYEACIKGLSASWDLLENNGTVHIWATDEMKTEYNSIYNIVRSVLRYKKIIFNDPATIVLWCDGTKTVVKCGKNDVYDPEKGVALCFMKKALGNKSGPFNKILKEELMARKEEK